MIDGFRYGMLDQADGSLLAGIIVMAAINVFLWGVSVWMFSSGYKLKA